MADEQATPGAADPNGSPAVGPHDIYREIHKALRFALAGVTTRLGACDPLDDASVQTSVDEWADVAFVLRGHHHHEDEFCDPLVRIHAPDLRDHLEAGHEQSLVDLERLDARAAAVLAAPPADRGELLQAFHLDAGGFSGTYLTHLRFEEEEVMPRLGEAMTEQELLELTMRIRLSVPPDQLVTYLRYMLPAMNPAERLDTLGPMHALMPPEVFAPLRAVAESSLAPDEYAAVARAAGFAEA